MNARISENQCGKTLALKAGLIAIFFLSCPFGASLAEAVRGSPDSALAATITYPEDQSLVRADVPVFGIACGKGFQQYRLEFGKGPNPSTWKTIKVSSRQWCEDPWTGRKVRWSPVSGAFGNLGTWSTGFSEYPYDVWKRDLNGIYTVRLVVEGKGGKTAEHRITLQVGRLITRAEGGHTYSPDKRLHCFVPASSLFDSAFQVLSIQPTTEIQVGPGYLAAGPIYEIRPPNLTFLKPAKLECKYKPEDLKALRARNQAVKETDLALYRFEPVDEVWIRLDSKVNPQAKTVTASISNLFQYAAYFALLADIATPAPPKFFQVDHYDGESRWVAFRGLAEPACTVRLFEGPRVVAETASDTLGLFLFPSVPITPGGHLFQAITVDASGKLSPKGTEVTVTRTPHPPRSVHSIKLLPPPPLVTNQRYLVTVRGKDSNSGVNLVSAKVTSEKSDPKGFEIELREVPERPGVYVGLLEVGARSDPSENRIAARVNGEKISFQLEQSLYSANWNYRDTLAPAAPDVTSPELPALCDNTFEPTSNPKGQWKNLGGKMGAELIILQDDKTPGSNYFLRLRPFQGVRETHLGTVAWASEASPFRPEDFSFLSFDYRLSPGTKMELVLKLRGWGSKVLLSNDEDSPYGTLQKALQFLDDGKWHFVTLNLASLLNNAYPQHKGRIYIQNLAFINWNNPRMKDLSPGIKTGGRTVYMDIDNFSIRKTAFVPPSITLQWKTNDPDVAGYSYLLDRSSSTLHEPQKILPETEKSFRNLEPGRWYFHVRACDSRGNWSASNHFPFIVGGGQLKTEFLPMENPLPWDKPVHIKFSGMPVDPTTLRLRVGEMEYDLSNHGLQFNPKTQTLSFHPHRVEPEGLLWTEGQKVKVTLTSAKDINGKPLEGHLEKTFRTTSPIEIIPPSPDQENGWYTQWPKLQCRHGAPPMLVRWAYPPEAAGPSIPLSNALEVTLQHNPKLSGKTVLRRAINVALIHKTQKNTSQKENQSHHQHPMAWVPGGLRAEYFADIQMKSKLEERLDPMINFDSRNPSALKQVPGAIAARWSGRLYIPETKEWAFELVTLPAAKLKLWLDGQCFIDSKYRSEKWNCTGRAYFRRGFYHFKIEFSQPNTPWFLQVFWEPEDNNPRQFISSAHFFHRTDFSPPALGDSGG